MCYTSSGDLNFLGQSHLISNGLAHNSNNFGEAKMVKQWEISPQIVVTEDRI